MRFLANENVPYDAVVAPQDRGHDAVWIRTDAPGSRDKGVLARAVAVGRVLLREAEEEPRAAHAKLKDVLEKLGLEV